MTQLLQGTGGLISLFEQARQKLLDTCPLIQRLRSATTTRECLDICEQVSTDSPTWYGAFKKAIELAQTPNDFLLLHGVESPPEELRFELLRREISHPTTDKGRVEYLLANSSLSGELLQIALCRLLEACTTVAELDKVEQEHASCSLGTISYTAYIMLREELN